MQTETDNAGASGLETLWQQVSAGVLSPPLCNQGNGSAGLGENGDRRSAEDDTRGRKPRRRNPRAHHAYRSEGGNSDALVRCYFDKPYSTERPRPESPELRAFYFEEAMLGLQRY